MAKTLDDALKLVKADPVVGYVSIPIIAARAPRPSIVVKMKGQTIILPDWNGTEWAWYAQLAIQIAILQPANNGSGEQDKARQLAKLRSELPAITALGSVKPTVKQAGDFYVVCVKLVIASDAAASGPTRGEMAAQAFGASLKEAPFTILSALKDVLDNGTELFFKDMPAAATRIVKDLFGKTVGGIFSGLGGFGPLILIGIGLWAFSKYGGSDHGEA